MELTVNLAYSRVVPLSCDIQEDHNQVKIVNSQPSNSCDLTVNPAYPRVTNNALLSCDVQEDYNQVDIVANEQAQPSNNSNSNFTVNPAYPRVINALLMGDIQEDHNQVEIEPAQPLLSSDIQEDGPQVEYISDLETSCSSSSSELSSYEDMQPAQNMQPTQDMQQVQYYNEMQPTLFYEEIPDNIVSGVQSEQNCAYNITRAAEDPPPSYKDIVRSRTNSLEENYAYNTVINGIHDNQEVYEVIPEAEEENRRETHPPIRVLCCFWQGRVELAIRLTILMVRKTIYVCETWKTCQKCMHR